MRGAPQLVQAFTAHVGIIPADAGSTSKVQIPVHWDTDHPRRCGEHLPAAGNTQGDYGSSPQMRGAQCDLIESPKVSGIIPADAGSTHQQCNSWYWHWGSSPQMRGAQELSNVIGGPEWIIPADAGSTHWPQTMGQPSHGSSPQMRGAQVFVIDLGFRRGIIPADAGSTLLQT